MAALCRLCRHMIADCHCWGEEGGPLSTRQIPTPNIETEKSQAGKHKLSPVWRLRGLAPRYARFTLALRPSMMGFGSLQALSAAARSAMVTWWSRDTSGAAVGGTRGERGRRLRPGTGCCHPSLPFL
uniref:cDNA FLJ39107 fis, clone NTONG2005062 n=1 Tax=Homo sapiens TaxID=9606 RepID=Q8N1N1_HUMAN|nr:unnamed protein product [Homo sapiens]